MNHNDKRFTFEQLLDKHSLFSVHFRNLQTLAIETYQVVNGGSPLIMNEIFKLSDEGRCNFRHLNTFKIPLVNVVYNGTETTSFLGLMRIKGLHSVSSFKKTIK